MTIPRIIHQIAPRDSTMWHPIWARCRQSWQKVFPNFEFRFWNDRSDIDDLVREHYPDYWEMYRQLPAHIMRIDFARLCILHKFGGIYADMDMFCYRDFFDELVGSDLFILEAPYGDIPIENALMAAAPNHDFFKACMDRCESNWRDESPQLMTDISSDETRKKVLFKSAGPGLILEVINQTNPTYNTLHGDVFNNHGMAYDPMFFTRHVLTGVWGHEARNYLWDCFRNDPLGHDTFADFQKMVFIHDAKKYSEDDTITWDDFDFFKDYTQGRFLKRHPIWSTIK